MHLISHLIKKQIIKSLLVVVILLITVLSGSAFAKQIYVAKTGSDTSNDGLSVASPFLTIQKAADAAVFGDVVSIRTGVYREMVDMKASGIVYQPYNGESVTINGTDLLLSWTLTSGSTYQTTVDWNVNPTWGTNQVFSDGKMIELARWPDQTSTDIIMPTNAKADDVNASGNIITITDADFNEPSTRWVGAKIWINLARNGKDGQGWTGIVLSVSGHMITVDFRGTPRLGDEPWGLGQNTEYFLFDPTPAGVSASGGVDALLSNGEWWKNENTMYVKTPNESVPSSTETGTNVIEAKRRHFAFWASTTRANYTIKDFNLFACAITTDNDARNNRSILEVAHDIILEGLNVLYPSHQTDMTGNWQDQHYAWSGMVVGGRNNIIRNCTIRYSATSAISIQGFNIKVLNNEIQDANYMCSNSGAMNTGFICKDSEIGYNKIWNTTMMAINFRYSQNSDPNIRDVYRIHHNEIFNFLRRSGDSGAIDVFGQDLQWARIDHNLIYNTLDDAKYGELKHGVYLDFGGAGRKIRVTIDHNIMYGITTPVLINNGIEVDLYNNVLLTHEDGPNAQFAVANFNGGNGEQIRVYNNIMSHPGNLIGCCGDLSSSDFRNNIINARGSVLNDIFVDANNGNFILKSTATDAIDKGISVNNYNDNVQGIPDLGAKEWGTFLVAPDTTPPSTPSAGFTLSNVASTSFNLSWTASTDNIAVASYDVYANGLLITNVPTNSVNLINLTSSTSYFITLKAVDATGNRSELSVPFEAKTLLSDAAISFAPTTIVVDGTKEEAWFGISYPITNSVLGSTSASDLGGNWTSLWDADNLYLFIDVTDDIKTVNSGSAWYDDDRIEIFVDADNNKGTSYGPRDYQYYIRPGESSISEVHFNATSNVELSNVNTDTGYKLEIKIPFATLGISGSALKNIGIDVQIGDDDGGGIDAKKAWHSIIDKTYQDPSLMGTAQLKNAGVADTDAPSTPVGLQASAITPNSFNLSWFASTDNIAVGSYEVYLNGNLIETINTNSYTIKNLIPETAYMMTVRAKDETGNISNPSEGLTVTTFALGSETKYEAEDAVLAGGAEVATNHSGFSGTGFAAGYGTEGASATFTVNVSNEGNYDVLLSYANNFGPSQTLSIYVNGEKIKQTALPSTSAWNSWATKSESLTLNEGNNTIKYQYDPSDGGHVNLDYISFYGVSADSQAPTTPTALNATTITNTGFTLSWAASTDNIGVTGYEIFKDGVSISTTSATTLNLAGLTAGTAYMMTVEAKDQAGNISIPSVGLSVTTLGSEAKYEAEDAVLAGGAETATNHSGFSGTGFAAGYGTEGASTTFTINISSAGIYDILLGYANNSGPLQRLSVYVNGVKIKQTALPSTGSWSSWATKSESLSLNAGTNTIKYQYDSGDEGNVNLDYISFDPTAGSLPVKLANFEVFKEGKVASLVWSTTEESNSNRFEIEHSINGKVWEKIGILESVQESNRIQKYYFTHRFPSANENLYRLKMVDNDETYSYSRIRSMFFNESNIDIYPNPTADKIFLKGSNQIKSISVINSTGVVVYENQALNYNELSLGQLSEGSYLLRINLSSGAQFTHKFIIKR
ncbi:sugar-binding protein [Dyadobacter sp. CY347]|uniref:sugar-binding protein n=1 Tax=Dyadobacter sp. CY347 TaxID=2909336 RepID=UPI001F3CE643|nr:sugar-binding protein [Dyadobacter sp. CY347]MCF2491639.1 carbohydrate-binding protein [Dyadobacter sp. CY347]